MADNFGLKIGLEGEKEFKKSISEINQTFKVLGSEMKLVTAQFDKNDNSIEALTARQQVLGKEVDAQRQKVETLRAALANATESFGENDRRTQAWQIQLNNAEATLIDLERELQDSTDALDKAGREMDDTGDQADDMGDEVGEAADEADPQHFIDVAMSPTIIIIYPTGVIYHVFSHCIVFQHLQLQHFEHP